MTQHELDTIIATGEGYKIEFKRGINTDLSRELVAFANSAGGRVFLGIDDNGHIPGISINNEVRSKVQMMARDCDPVVDINIEEFNNVLIVHVPEGENKPYRCTGGFYVRSGASSTKLTTQEISDLFKVEGKVKFDELLAKNVKYPEHLDIAALDTYMKLIGTQTTLTADELLINLGIITRTGQSTVINNTGILFFALQPAVYIPQCVVTCVAYKGNTKVDIIDSKKFYGNIITNIDATLVFLKRHLNVSYEIKSKLRREKLEIPEVVLREAIVNAVAHRDYFEKGAEVMIEVFDNRLEISNPGGLPKGLMPENFGTRTLARNPLIASLLNRAGYIEKLGTGIPRIRKAMSDAGLPEPEFNFDNFFVVRLRRYNFSSALKQELSLNDKRAERMAYILRQLTSPNTTLNVEQIATGLNTTSRTIRNDLDILIQAGWLQGSGTTKGRDYELTGLGIEKMQKYS